MARMKARSEGIVPSIGIEAIRLDDQLDGRKGRLTAEEVQETFSADTIPADEAHDSKEMLSLRVCDVSRPRLKRIL